MANIFNPTTFVPQRALAFGGEGGASISVAYDTPCPVESGGEGSRSVTIAAAASLTTPIDLGRQRLHRIEMPTVWTAAGISFQVSADGITYCDLYDITGEIVLAVAAARAIVVDPAVFHGVRFVKIRSGTSGTPVVQTDARSITLATVAR